MRDWLPKRKKNAVLAVSDVRDRGVHGELRRSGMDAAGVLAGDGEHLGGYVRVVGLSDGVSAPRFEVELEEIGVSLPSLCSEA